MKIKSIKNMLAIASLSLLTLGITTNLSAQSNTGNISGEIVGADSGTTVTATDESRGITKSASVDNKGNFSFRSLTPGKYTITVSENGKVVDTQSLEVVLGSTRNILMGTTESDIDEIIVSGTRTQALDTSIGEIGVVISAADLEVLPVQRDLDAITLLAPGVSEGDSAFAGTSFSGSSVAENTSYINGLNTTNFRNGLGFSEVPFEFYDTIQIKTGGYSAKYGRTTGGVINAKSKSGSNDFGFGANLYYDTDLSTSPNTRASDNNQDEYSATTLDVYASGAIIQDRVFFYGLVSQENVDAEGYSLLSGRGSQQERDTTFWGAKIDAFITENHKIELTAFSDERETVEANVAYDAATQTVGANFGDTLYKRGGLNWVATYTGDLTDKMQVSLTAGYNEADRSTLPASADIPVVYTVDTNDNFIILGDWTDFSIDEGLDERTMYRADLSYELNDRHFLEFGIDTEANTSTNFTVNSGGVYWLLPQIGNTLYTCTAAECPSGTLARQRTYASGGEFDVDSNSYYIQDTWEVNDDLTVELGLRNETFKNYNAAGETFVEVNNQWAPRVSAVWDPTGTGQSKVFANYGLYYLPIASNTNIRLAGGETYIHDFFDWDGACLNADSTPCNLGAQYRQDVFADGSVPDTRSLTDGNIDAMYQSEFILGYSFTNDSDVTYGIKGIYRNLESSIEDVAIDAAVINYYNSNGTWDAALVGGDTVEDVFGGFHQYVLTNPGNDMSIYIPEQDETIDLTTAQLGYPDAKRQYLAVETTFARPFDGKWGAAASYTWAHSWGNNEGYVRSDNDQDDAGLTTNFDQPGLLDGGYGDLPNDRTHTLKVYGNYEFNNGIRVGANALLFTGRPKNCFGEHPTDVFAAAYGNASFYCDGNLVPRGSLGKTDTIFNLDVNGQYTFDLPNDSDLTLSMDLFNVLDIDGVTAVNEIGNSPGFGQATGYQSPRALRLSARYKYR